MTARSPLFIALALALAVAPASAQKSAPKKPAASAAPTGQPAPVAEPAPPPRAPYEGPMLRLAELLGALAYLRDLCGAGDGGAFRQQVRDLMEAEPAAREKIAGAFNRGYRGYEASYRTCTPNAHTIVARFLAEGGRLARDIATRYGG